MAATAVSRASTMAPAVGSMKTIPVDKSIKLQATPDWYSPPSGRWIVVWHRQVLPRIVAEHTEPLVNVTFRNLDALTPDGDGPREFTRVDRPVTELSQLRLGTIVCDGHVTERVQLESTRDFSVVFPDTGGSLRWLTNLEIQTADLPPWFAGVGLGGYALALPLSGGGHLWIPCMEFLTRFYGRSQDIKRVLLTYPWSWSKPRLLDSETPSPEASSGTDVWRVRFGWRARHLVSGDAVFLAHLRHSSWTRRCAHRLYAQMEPGHPTIAGAPFDGVHLAVDAWFSGPALLRVSGFPLSDGGFLALRLDGASDPQGPRIVRERVRRAPGRAARADGVDQGRLSRSRRSLVALRRGQTPDRGSFHIPLPDPPFEVLGAPQAVDEVTVKLSSLGPRRSRPPGYVDAVASTAEPTGSGKDIESAIIHAPPGGALHEVWNALCHLHQRFSDRILLVHWYHPSCGFVFSQSPRLVLLTSRASLREREPDRLSVDPGPHGGDVDRRAFLVVRVVVSDESLPGSRRTLYLVEVERRMASPSQGEEGKSNGLIFELRPNGDPVVQLDRWLSKLLADLVRSRGLFRRQLCAACPGRAVPFTHLPAQAGTPGERAVRDALREMGVLLPE